MTVRALALDTGGTVLDWYRGVRNALAEAGARRSVVADWDEITRTYRKRSLQTMLGAVGPRFNIDDVHREVLETLLAKYRLDVFTPDDRERIWRSWHELIAWPDVSPAFSRLRQRFTIVSFTILSTSLVIDVSRRNRLTWDCLIACEMLGVYKPQPEAYRAAAKLLALPPGEILMVACHNFDLLAARQEGFRSAFVHRPDEWGPAGPPDPVPDPAHDYVADDFGQLADQL